MSTTATPIKTASAASTVLPAVTVIVPIFNEEQHIRACAENLLTQTYSPELVTLLLVDGRSTDKTREVIEELIGAYPNRQIKLLDNPKRGVAAALNVGIKAAEDDIIVRADAHSVPQATFIEQSVTSLLESGAAYAGGMVDPQAETPFGKAVALAMVHPLGAGGAAFRTATTPQFADTAFLGAFRKTLFDEVGLFNERLVCNEDYELNTRIRKSDNQIYLDPKIKTVYVPRDTPEKLWQQYFNYGWWKLETLKLHPDSLRLRQLMPVAFVGAVLFLGLLSPIWIPARYLLGLALILYLGVLGLVTLKTYAKKESRLATVWRLPLAMATMHIAWGTGFLTNFFTGGKLPRWHT